MSIIEKLATSLQRKDEVPNQELALQIVRDRDTAAVKTLVGHLADKNKGIQSDCIKTLYEIGTAMPVLIAPYAKDFVALLDSRNNRLQWGAMTALNAITLSKPDVIYTALARLAEVADAGSVITRDNYVGILTKLLGVKKYSDSAFQLLQEQLQTAATNQLPMYAENAASAIPEQHRAAFARILTARLDEFDKESKRKRVEKVLKKLDKK